MSHSVLRRRTVLTVRTTKVYEPEAHRQVSYVNHSVKLMDPLKPQFGADFRFRLADRGYAFVYVGNGRGWVLQRVRVKDLKTLELTIRQFREAVRSYRRSKKRSKAA